MNKRDDLKVYAVDPANPDAAWSEIKRACPYLSDWGIDNLSNGLNGVVKSILLEPFYVCKDHRNLFSNFYSKKFIESPAYTNRLHFFSESSVTVPQILLDTDKFRSSYLGFSVIRPVVDRCIGRTIIDPMKLQISISNDISCLRTSFSVHIAGARLEVKGYPYISQDGDVTVCAHTALWGICRYLSERYPVYKEIYPFDLVNFTGNSRGRIFPYRGMTYSDYSSILSEFGTYPVILYLDPSKPDEYRAEYKNLYTYVESGFPTVASYAGHVVSLIGHTLDYTLNPTAGPGDFIDSSEFVDHFVVIDDNYFPYQLLGKRGDPKNYGQWALEDIAIAVCPLPEKVFLPAEKAREWASRYFFGLRQELQSTGSPPFVTRLFVTTNSSFKKRCLQRVVDGGSIDLLSYFVQELNLPHFVWVMEAGPLEQYRLGKCSAEIVLDPTANDPENAMIYTRIGNSLWFDGGKSSDPNCPKVYKQYTHNLGEK